MDLGRHVRNGLYAVCMDWIRGVLYLCFGQLKQLSLEISHRLSNGESKRRCRNHLPLECLILIQC